EKSSFLARADSYCEQSSPCAVRKALAQPMKVLVVDDDHLSRRLLAQALEKSGYHVLDCRDGVEALQLLEDSGPAIIVLDYQMPEFNGAQICEIIRGSPDPDIAQVPIIF